MRRPNTSLKLREAPLGGSPMDVPAKDTCDMDDMSLEKRRGFCHSQLEEALATFRVRSQEPFYGTPYLPRDF